MVGRLAGHETPASVADSIARRLTRLRLKEREPNLARGESDGYCSLQVDGAHAH